MALGIPSSAPLAVLIGGLMMYGLAPGPLLFKQHADFAWTVIGSMYVGNVMLLLINLPLVGIWARLIRVPYPLLATLIVVFGFIGSYSIRSSFFDVWVSLTFGVIGYLMRKFDYPTTPLVLCLILAPIIESSLGQSMSMAGGDPAIFVTRPITFVLLVAAAASLVLAMLARRKAAHAVAMMVTDAD
jgi:putative tricarboxylic transport membrane protein